MVINILTSLSRYIYRYLSEIKGCLDRSLENVWVNPQRFFNCRLCLQFKLS